MGWQALTFQFIKGTRAGTDPFSERETVFQMRGGCGLGFGFERIRCMALCAIFFIFPL